MFSLPLSILLIVVQAVFCNDLGCEPAGTPREAPAASHAMSTAEAAPSRRYNAADLGRAAIDMAFSGVVEIGDGPVAALPPPTVTC